LVVFTRLWPWSYGSWIYNYLCYQCLSPLMLWVRISIRARCTTLCDTVCQWLATGLWFSLGPLGSSTNKTNCHDTAEILLKVVLNTIKQTTNKTRWYNKEINWFIIFLELSDISVYSWRIQEMDTQLNCISCNYGLCVMYRCNYGICVMSILSQLSTINIYLMEVICFGCWNLIKGENHWPATSQWQTVFT
jgi:hypothetical protein